MPQDHTDRKEAAASKRAAKDREEETINEDDEDDDGVFEVERVVGHRRDVENKELFFFLKWKGYPHEDNTWEREDQVFCTDLISEYWQRHLERGGSKDDIYAEESLEKKPSKRGSKASTSSSINASSSSSSAATTTKANGTSSQNSSRSLLPEVPPLGSSKSNPGSTAASTTTSRRSKEKSQQGVVSSNKRQKTMTATTTTTTSTISKPTWTPPSSWTLWEEHVVEVRDVERRDDNLIVHLSWKNGHETLHNSEDVHVHCPRKLLKFYEDHLKFREA